MRMMLVFKKEENLRHVGHLDLMRTMQRAFRRSELPLAYSKGYNPHIIMSFAAPLSVGVWGEREVLEVELTESLSGEKFLRLLNPNLPAGLEGLEALPLSENERSLMSQVRGASYVGRILDANVGAVFVKKLQGFLQQDEITALKKTKKGMKKVDIKPMIFGLEIIDHQIKGILALHEQGTCKPDMLLKSLSEFCHISEPLVLWGRKEILKENQAGKLLPLESM